LPAAPYPDRLARRRSSHSRGRPVIISGPTGLAAVNKNSGNTVTATTAQMPERTVYASPALRPLTDTAITATGIPSRARCGDGRHHQQSIARPTRRNRHLDLRITTLPFALVAGGRRAGLPQSLRTAIVRSDISRAAARPQRRSSPSPPHMCRRAGRRGARRHRLRWANAVAGKCLGAVWACRVNIDV